MSTAAPSALSISVRWGDRLISSHLLRPDEKRPFRLGPSGDSDVTVSRAGQAEFSWTAEGPSVRFTDGVRGEVLRNGELALPMSEAIQLGLAREDDQAWVLPLGRRDGLTLRFGRLAVEAWPAKAPRKVGLEGVEWDYRWLNVLLATAMVAALLVMRFELAAMEGEAFGDDLTSSMTAMRRVLVVAARPEPVRRDVEPEKVKAPPKSTPSKAGAARPTQSKGTRGVGGTRAAGPDVRHLFAGLGGQGVLGNGGLSKDLNDALGNVKVAANGLGGLAMRGPGGGGEVGGPVGIGAIGLLNGPRGPRDPVLHAAPKTAGPFIDDTPPVIDCNAVGCLDKELIRRVVREHLGQVRYCYEVALQRAPSLAGRVVVKWHVTGGGAVDASEVVSSTANNAQLGECLASRVRTWTFPAAKAAEAGFTVSYPFVFKQSGT